MCVMLLLLLEFDIPQIGQFVTNLIAANTMLRSLVNVAKMLILTRLKLHIGNLLSMCWLLLDVNNELFTKLG